MCYDLLQANTQPGEVPKDVASIGSKFPRAPNAMQYEHVEGRHVLWKYYA